MKEFERLFAEATDVGKEIHEELELARESNRELQEFLAGLGVTKKPTVAQWLERKREDKRLQLQTELMKWDSNKKEREAFVVKAKQLSEERIARHSSWSRQKELTLLNIREKQRLLELGLGTSAGADLFSKEFAKNPYIHEPKSTRAVHSRHPIDLHSRPILQTSPQRMPPGTFPRSRSPRPPTKPRSVSRPVSIRMTEKGLLRIAEPSHTQDSAKSRMATALDPNVAKNPIWLRATGPKSTARARSLIQLRPEEYIKLERFRKNLASFPLSPTIVEKPPLRRNLSSQSV